ncbi:MAG TPA: hypothetical protein V6C78_32810 [Crinalium sp.]
MPPLQLMDEQHFYTSGNVTIHPSVAIAPGVLLQADPDSHLILGEGVCVGAGAVLHAHGGTLEVEAGVSLGSGVLIIGSAKIGMNACIGSRSTLLDCSVDADQVVPPGSLRGDTSRQISESSENSHSEEISSEEVSSEEISSEEIREESMPVAEAMPSMTDTTSPPDIERQPSTQPGSIAKPTQVYGADSFNQLMTMLFPHRQTLNGSSNGSSANLQPPEGRDSSTP